MEGMALDLPAAEARTRSLSLPPVTRPGSPGTAVHQQWIWKQGRPAWEASSGSDAAVPLPDHATRGQAPSPSGSGSSRV